jgi:hypothetical protein
LSSDESAELRTSAQNPKSLGDRAQAYNDDKIERVLKEVEENSRRSILAHIKYHKYLEEVCAKRNDAIRAGYHAVRVRVYQQILANMSLSSAYNRR